MAVSRVESIYIVAIILRFIEIEQLIKQVVSNSSFMLLARPDFVFQKVNKRAVLDYGLTRLVPNSND